MKACILFLTYLLVATNTNSQNYSVIKFLDGLNFNELTNIARKEKKSIFMEVSSPPCDACGKMDQSVYSNDSVAKYMNAHFTSIKIQIIPTNDSTYKQSQLMNKIKEELKITASPLFLFWDTAGNLTHWTKGYLSTDQLIKNGKIALDHNDNFTGRLNSVKNNSLKEKELLQFAVDLTIFRNDSLAYWVAKKYKDSYLEKRDFKTILTADILPVFQNFSRLYTINDSLTKYIYQNKRETDSALKFPSFTDRILEAYIKRDMITPELNSIRQPTKPDWDKIEYKISKQWDSRIAHRTVLDSKINWYKKNNYWNEAAKYQIEKTQKSGFTIFDNNIFWETFVLHCDDPNLLQQAGKCMKEDTDRNPNNYDQLDTYASILYKSGEKKLAIATEQKALTMAEKSNDQEAKKTFLIRLKKMQKEDPSWLE
ncbi:thioredoxin family protein [Chitinophaga flava]|uniref:Spermatogenesis-associated protein 20-like TRX domain-containing protein n=1 Tax=Chitinophaga flava TaxID=2259036 RepID=A0A365XSP3_9BACT|nr:DUF255 domain-containing protein [Chitinophaga flava]RBL89353.1 hypothetical protein DF182_22800 [Chitinophaga flava]